MSTDLEQRVADAMKQARIDEHWASAPDGENFVCAQAAIAAVLDALPEMVTDAMVEALAVPICFDKNKYGGITTEALYEGLKAALAALKGEF
jgi:hypothetical protein